jgi:hypothetical protein
MRNTFDLRVKGLAVSTLVSILAMVSLQTQAADADGIEVKAPKVDTEQTVVADSESNEQVMYMDTLTRYSNLQKNLLRRNIKVYDRRFTNEQPVQHNDSEKQSSLELVSAQESTNDFPAPTTSLISETAID